MAVIYGDYPPISAHVVRTAYVGVDSSAMFAAIRQDHHWSGGNARRNALHEALAAVLHNMRLLGVGANQGLGWSLCNLMIASATDCYHLQAPLITFPQVLSNSNTPLKALIEALFAECRVGLRLVMPCSLRPHSQFLKVLQELFSPANLSTISESIPSLPKWTLIETRGLTLSVDEQIKKTSTTTLTPLELAVADFLQQLASAPCHRRRDLLDRHLASPAFAADYKELLMLRAKSLLPSVEAIWSGSFTFHSSTGSTSFTMDATPFPSTLSNSNDSNALADTLMISSWPSELVVSAFVPIQAPAVSKCAAICQNVLLRPHVHSGNQAAIEGFLNLLKTRGVVAVVRLNDGLAMLVSYQRQILSAMVISRHAASEASSSSSSSMPANYLPTPPAMTPVEILSKKQHPTPMETTDQNSNHGIIQQNNQSQLDSAIDVFGALSQDFFEDQTPSSNIPNHDFYIEN